MDLNKEFFKDIASTTKDTVINTVKSTVRNTPAIGTMVLASYGLSELISPLLIEGLFIPVPFIAEMMVLPVLSVLLVFCLALLAGNSYQGETT